MENEKEYIERESVINKINNLLSEYEDCDGIFIPKRLIPSGLCKVLNFIKQQPTADAQEVKHGKWTPMHHVGGILDGENFDKCSVCGYERFIADVKYKTIYNYCPNCGAKMDKKDED